MDENEIRDTLSEFNTGVDLFTQVVEKRIYKIDVLMQGELIQLRQNIEFEITSYTPTLIRAIDVLHQKANYNIIRFTLHASPEVLAILTAIWAAIQILWEVVKWIVWIINTFKIIQIHGFIMDLFPKYREFFENLMSKVSELSAHIGWGVDGVLHLLFAAEGGINVIGGLMGKDWTMMRWEMMDKGINISQKVSRMLTQIKENPGKWMSILFENASLETADISAKWWSGVSDVISIASDKAKTALEGTQGVIGELLAIQNDMPEMVRNNIPSIIWERLAEASSFINDKILPHIARIDRNIQFIDAILRDTRRRASELAAKLAHPGDVLLGVDELPDYVKAYQERLIDDVTSREFEFWTNQERSEMQVDFDEFDRVDRLATAPTPEPVFLSMEVPVGRTIRGITAEPHETWFVGDF